MTDTLSYDPEDVKHIRPTVAELMARAHRNPHLWDDPQCARCLAETGTGFSGRRRWRDMWLCFRCRDRVG